MLISIWITGVILHIRTKNIYPPIFFLSNGCMILKFTEKNPHMCASQPQQYHEEILLGRGFVSP